MKASRNPNTFTPVILALESQAEVDAIFSVLNHTRICDVLGFDSEYHLLEPFKTDKGAADMHHKIQAILKT